MAFLHFTDSLMEVSLHWPELSGEVVISDRSSRDPIQLSSTGAKEIRRGKDPIDGDHLPSDGSGTHYTMTFIEHLTAHAEFLRRLGDNSLYDHVARDGSGSLLQAYMFVVDNPKKSHGFTANRINALYLAYNYYRHPALLAALKKCGPGDISGQRMALFGRLTRPFQLEKLTKKTK